jgi:group I intron endonuclease
MNYINIDTCGVYGIFEGKKGNVLYVGSSNDIFRRYKEHFLGIKSGNHSNDKLLKLAEYYGFNNLEFKVLFYCSEDELLLREMQMIKLLSPVCNTANNTLGFSKNVFLDNDFFLIKSHINGHKVKTTDISKVVFEKTNRSFSAKKVGSVLAKLGYKSYQAPNGERFHVLINKENLSQDMRDILFGELKHINKIYISDIVSRLSYVTKAYEIIDVLKFFGYKTNKGEDGKIYYSKK